MPEYESYYFKKRNAEEAEHRARQLRPLTFFLIIVAIIFAMSVFFKVSHIKVEGNSRYTAQQIIDASGVHTGDNLFFMDRIGAGTRVTVKLPYVDSVKISRKLPSTIVISVTESKAAASIDVGETSWSISSTGKFLAELKSDSGYIVPHIVGISVSEAAVGDFVKAPEGDEARLAYALEIIDQIQARGMISDISEIDMSDINNPSFAYGDRFTVYLGARENTEYKFGKLVSTLKQLSSDDYGTLDLSDGDKVLFRPN